MWEYFKPQEAGIRRANLVIDSPQLASLAIMQISGTGVTGTAAAIPTLGGEALGGLVIALATLAAWSMRRRKG
jgi:hypothetical protein